jgi:hypothetical protein
MNEPTKYTKKCIKCGQVKSHSEYYGNNNGNTCKDCIKEAQKIRWAQRKIAKEKNAKISMEEILRKNYINANCWIDGLKVMEKGTLIGQQGKDWWKEKKKKHKRWLIKKRMGDMKK